MINIFQQAIFIYSADTGKLGIQLTPDYSFRRVKEYPDVTMSSNARLAKVFITISIPTTFDSARQIRLAKLLGLWAFLDPFTEEEVTPDTPLGVTLAH